MTSRPELLSDTAFINADLQLFLSFSRNINVYYVVNGFFLAPDRTIVLQKPTTNSVGSVSVILHILHNMILILETLEEISDFQKKRGVRILKLVSTIPRPV